MSDIFKSRFSLKFKRQEIEAAYQCMRDKNMRQYNIIYSIINILMSIAHIVVYTNQSKFADQFLFTYIKISTYVICGFLGLILFLCIYIRNSRIHRWLSYINISLIFLITVSLRIYLAHFIHVDYLVFNLVFILQQFYTQNWFFTNNLDFLDGFWIYLKITVTSYFYFLGIIPIHYSFRSLISGIIIMTTSFFSYFYVKEKRYSFYYKFQNECTIKWYQSIIDNMNSGFISIQNSNINCLNKTLIQHFNKIADPNSENDELVFGKNSFANYESEENKNCLMNYLFNEISFDKGVNINNYKTDYETALDYLKNYKFQDGDVKEKFIFLGNKSIKNKNENNSDLYYEIFGRYCNVSKEEREENFEFMFNDVSKTKINEEINADIKYKTIFLSKVAHEFKNPLICVSEIVDQMKEQIEATQFGQNINENVKNKITQIKSLCEYLLILVKDLDFFSLKYPGSTNKIKLEKENVRLVNVINYCDNITQVLLKKYQKEDALKFIIDCSHELYNQELVTDELRLKQLLINLLSNSVKYTFNGSITLQIKEEEESMLFNVIDTGKGLTEEEKIRLKTNSIANREITANSSSLGFYIIKDIDDLLGTHLDYEPMDKNGSKFFFRIPKSKNYVAEKLVTSHESLKFTSNKYENLVTETHLVLPVKSEEIKLNTKFGNTTNSTINIINACDDNSLKPEEDADYYIVVDDEKITRKSTIRILNKYLSKPDPNKRKKIIIEASDGIECLHLFYQCIKKGIKLSFIISDENMAFLNGESCARILYEIVESKSLNKIPFFIVSAYESMDLISENGIDGVFSKPLSLKQIENIFLISNKIKK